MCNCIETVSKKAREHIKEDVEKRITVAQWLNEGVFDNIGFGMNGFNKIGIPFIAEYRLKKKDGTGEHKIRKKIVFIDPTFCPFCGEKFES